jgi:hypothetical protein
MSCPSDFDTTTSGKCVLKCISNTKSLQDGDVYKCISSVDNAVSVSLKEISVGALPEEFQKERDRFQQKYQEVLQAALRNAQKTGIENVASYSRIQGEYAGIKAVQSSEASIGEVNQSLKPFRPKTAPESDIQIERRRILDSSAPNMLLLQVALALVLLCILAYALIPSYAGILSFLLLSVGVALGIFLRK